MTSAEFSLWWEYAKIEPFGYEIENYRAGVVAATVANVAPRKKGAKPLKPSDFYPASSANDGLTAEQRDHIRKKHGKRRHSNR